MEYSHTQRAPMVFLLQLLGGGLILSALLFLDHPMAPWALLAFGAMFLLLGSSFGTLTVADEGDHLRVRFGPLPLLGTSIDYTSITRVEPDRSSIMDGFGAHYHPTKGWIYNLWGFDCVRIHQGQKTVRIGTDDQANLVQFLRGKITPSGR